MTTHTSIPESAARIEGDKATNSTVRNIALIGCGAIAQNFYLPVLAKHRARFGNLWLVDPGDRSRSAANAITQGHEARSLADVPDVIQLAIIATPNGLHFPLACEALSRGADILLEKPFVIFPSEGKRLMETADANRRVIAINQTRRFFPIARPLRQRIAAGEFGFLESIVHREGTRLAWPFESGAGFAPDARRTGVIMDFGVHVLDFYHYLLQPTWTLESAIHDGFNGPEGLAEIKLRANDSPVCIRLSRYHQQENVARMRFERAEVSFHVHGATSYSIRSNAGKAVQHELRSADATADNPAERLLLNFLAASEKRESAVCDPASSLPVIELLDNIYRSALRYPATIGYV
jgi:predicted dehydrogenase